MHLLKLLKLCFIVISHSSFTLHLADSDRQLQITLLDSYKMNTGQVPQKVVVSLRINEIKIKINLHVNFCDTSIN